jgi:hypothetical protein
MSEEIKEVPVPLAIRQLIELHNSRIREYQQKSLREIQDASVELMSIIGLLPQDGWRLDVEGMKYVKVSTDGNSQVSRIRNLHLGKI